MHLSVMSRHHLSICTTYLINSWGVLKNAAFFIPRFFERDDASDRPCQILFEIR